MLSRKKIAGNIVLSIKLRHTQIHTPLNRTILYAVRVQSGLDMDLFGNCISFWAHDIETT